MTRPAFQFYPGDWLNNAGLRSCSVAARGLWMEMMCLMHQSDRYGHLRINGTPVTVTMLARMVGATASQVMCWQAELEATGVFAVIEGCIISRRMVKDERTRTARAAGGHLGGNPNLTRKPEVTPEVAPEVGDKVNLPPNLEPTPSSSSSSSSSTSQKKAEKKESAPKGSHLPPDWALPDDWASWARAKRPDLDIPETAATFADHWHSVPGSKGLKLDWMLTWRNWVRGQRAPPQRFLSNPQAKGKNDAFVRAFTGRNPQPETIDVIATESLPARLVG